VDSKLFKRAFELGKEGAYLRLHRSRGRDIALSLHTFLKTLATRLQLAGFDISRSGVSKIEARLRFVDDKDLMFLAEVLRVPIQALFPRREHPGRLSDFMEKLETTRF
jgi:transcriptional regulator with XRE-family HTH domain